MFWKRMAERLGGPPNLPPLLFVPGAGGGPSNIPPTPPFVPGGHELKGRPLGRVLVKMGKVTREQVVEALVYQKKHGGLLGDVMVKLGFVQPADIHAALAGQRGEGP